MKTKWALFTLFGCYLWGIAGNAMASEPPGTMKPPVNRGWQSRYKATSGKPRFQTMKYTTSEGRTVIMTRELDTTGKLKCLSKTSVAKKTKLIGYPDNTQLDIYKLGNGSTIRKRTISQNGETTVNYGIRNMHNWSPISVENFNGLLGYGKNEQK